MTKKEILEILNYNFSDLNFFEEDHTYVVKDKNFTPTSNMIKRYYEPFDEYNQSLKYAKKHGKTQKEVLDEWHDKRDKGCARGTEVHDFAEKYIEKLNLKESLYLSAKDPLFNRKMQVVKFWKDLPSRYECIKTELRMYNDMLSFAGTTDFLLYDKEEKTIVVGDYKTNRQLFDSYNKYMLYPFDYLEDTDYNHYQLQLSFYQILLEQVGIPISERMLVWIKEDDYKIYNTINFTSEILKAENYVE